MTQTLNVEHEELMARADELERPLPTIPSSKPVGPCALSFVNDAALRLARSADTLQMYLKQCEREWKSLAKSLRNAAKAYEQVDEGAADAINNESSSGVTPAAVTGNDEPFAPPPPAPMAADFQYPYYEVRQAAVDIEAPDQGTSFKAFAQEWDAFQKAFREEDYRFRMFTSWEGEARQRVEENFRQQKEWIFSTAQLCTTLGRQADRVVEVHKRATARTGYQDQHAMDNAHPTTYEVSQCDYWYKLYSERYSVYLPSAIEWYEKLQISSETVLKYYVKTANLPLAPVNPTTPPKATVIKLPGETPSDSDTPPQDEAPAPGAGLPDMKDIGNLVGGISQGMQPVMQGMQGVTQGLQGIMQGAQSLGQGGMGAGAIPAELASDTTKLDEPPPEEGELVDETEKADGETPPPDHFAAGAAAVREALGGAPVQPPAPGGPETVL